MSHQEVANLIHHRTAYPSRPLGGITNSALAACEKSKAGDWCARDDDPGNRHRRRSSFVSRSFEPSQTLMLPDGVRSDVHGTGQGWGEGADGG